MAPLPCLFLFLEAGWGVFLFLPRDLLLHLCDQHPQLLPAFLPRVGAHPPCVLLAAGPDGQAAALEQVVALLADTAGAGPGHAAGGAPLIFRSDQGCRLFRKSLAGHESDILPHRAAKKPFHGLGLKGCLPSRACRRKRTGLSARTRARPRKGKNRSCVEKRHTFPLIFCRLEGQKVIRFTIMLLLST